MGLIEISVFIIAIAFCALVIYMIKVLKSVDQSLAETEKTLNHLQKQVDELGKETSELLHNTNKVVVDLDQKSKALNPVFETVHEAGEAAHQLSSSVIQASSTLSKGVKNYMGQFESSIHRESHDPYESHRKTSAEPYEDQFTKAFQAVSLGLFLMRKWKERKQQRSSKKQA